MGVCRDTDGIQVDMVKEMAEGLGNSGAALEQLIAKASEARKEVLALIDEFNSGSQRTHDSDHLEMVNDSVTKYNCMVDRAQHALDWLLIQREACGFRTHRHVNRFYPIPQKIRLLKK